MKTVKVMIAATQELHQETLDFTNLLAHLNHVFEARGIRLRPVNWDPDEHDLQQSFQDKIKDCEMCMSIYWKELPNSAHEQIGFAYNQSKQGNNPLSLYIFFKEPVDGICEAMEDFKASFEKLYGHFYCKFENTDTMNLNFVLQFIRLYGNQDKELVTVDDGMLKVGGEPVVNLDNVPFAKFNGKYIQLRDQLLDLDQQISEKHKQSALDPDNKEFFNSMTRLIVKRSKIADEFEQYAMRLYDIALNFAQRSGESYSRRMALAREQFEQGNAVEADRILDLQEMKQEAQREKAQFTSQRENLLIKIDEFRLKADTVMANSELTIPDRFADACDAYNEAIEIARMINYQPADFAGLLFDYAHLLSDFNHMVDAAKYYGEALEIHRKLANGNPEAYLPDVAATLNNLAALQCNLGRFGEAEKNFDDALKIYRKLADGNLETYLPDVAMTLNNLALLQNNLDRFGEAEKNYGEALEIHRKLANGNPEAYLPDVALTLNNLAILHNNLGLFGEAEKNYSKALDIYRKLAEGNPEAYLPKVAQTLNNLAILNNNLGRYGEAEKSYSEALEIYRKHADDNPEAYLTKVAMTLNNLAVLQGDSLGSYGEAEKNYGEALEIRRKLANGNPEAFLPDVAATLNNLAALKCNLGRYGEAEKNFYETLKIYSKLADGNPEAFLPDVAMTLNNMGWLYEDMKQFHLAIESFKEALIIREQLEAKHPGMYAQKIQNLKDAISATEAKIADKSSIIGKLFKKFRHKKG